MTHVCDGRTVMTYEVDATPVGVITGYPWEQGFLVEHVITLRPGVMLPMVRAALIEAYTRQYRLLAFHLPSTFALSPRLARLAERWGFTPYAEQAGATYYVRHL